MMRVIVCGLCDGWRPEYRTPAQARDVWAAHKDQHCTEFRAQLDVYQTAGVCFSCWFATASGTAHRPCYTVDCDCSCSC
jgi:hypothetical protein